MWRPSTANVSGTERGRVDRGDLGGGDLAVEEMDVEELGIDALRQSRVLVGHARQLLRAPHDDRDLQAVLLEQDRAQRSADRCLVAGGVEHDIAALDVGDDALETGVAARCLERRHGDLVPATDVDPAKQRDPTLHDALPSACRARS